MNFGDKLFILFLNACWMFFIYYLVRIHDNEFLNYLPFIIPASLIVICFIMLIQLRDESTKDVKVREFDEEK
ncbi:hypothetical protein BFS35_002015 [Macrococcoides goetzii]|uniref:Uncharacterized protein n=1 Tax=Macrococcoides goetzii TaxID=1891097 RepID=A0A2G5NT01_9STAP|nr:hypothetical protein [Macrococcus goetzii]RAI82485.1 hypothetical protein BFS35_002015 [Macrococcus goetzii]